MRRALIEMRRIIAMVPPDFMLLAALVCVALWGAT